MPAIIRNLGLQPYEPIWRDMQTFTQDRTEDTNDEIWLLKHSPVYTLGLNGKMEHVLNPENIPVINSDRGGQVTYHGPGQAIVYTLLDLKRLQLGVRPLVTLLEQAMITTLAQFDITATAKPEAPGVYVNNKKIGSIGIRIRRNCSYHGLSLNNNMDLAPFDRINTCGFKELQVTQLADFDINIGTGELAAQIARNIDNALIS
ncbi:MAG: lipoyl(octanoyl) transferase LipB [Gammaproteobacteria bacterium]|nr:lipoyl(octanoyl) transferase LipB [Gammaproteobacteria bacterium]